MTVEKDTISNKIYACEPGYLVEYLSRLESIPETLLSEIERNASLFAELKSEQPEIMTISKGVATIAIEGPLSKNGPGLFELLFGFGGASYGDIQAAVESAATDPEVNRVELLIDSPGGGVDGVDETRAAIARATAEKDVVAINTGMIASAAYWLASAANEIQSTSPTNLTGSIGVVAVAIDRSKRDSQWGIVRVVSRNAPDKRPDLSTSEGRSVLQDQVDAIERAFITRIAQGRKISAEKIKSDFGRGRMLIAQDPDSTKPSALSVGMIDKVIEGFKEVAASDAGPQNKIAGQSAGEIVKPLGAAGELQMSEEMKAKIAELENQLKGALSSSDDLAARMKTVAPILASDAYPAVIKKIAADVLAGTEHPKALEGAVALHDANEANKVVAVARQASNDAPVASVASNSVPADGSVSSPESLNAAIETIKREMGR